MDLEQDNLNIPERINYLRRLLQTTNLLLFPQQIDPEQDICDLPENVIIFSKACFNPSTSEYSPTDRSGAGHLRPPGEYNHLKRRLLRTTNLLMFPQQIDLEQIMIILSADCFKPSTFRYSSNR
jgi:hypothetical protein